MSQGYTLRAGRVIVGPSGQPLVYIERTLPGMGGDTMILPTEADRFAHQIVDALNTAPGVPGAPSGERSAMARTHTAHGYAILDRKPSTVDGCAIIVAYRGGPFQPFVIWRMDADGACEGGQYVDGIVRAGEAFEERK